MGGWIEANPNQATLIAQTLGGAAKGMMDERTADKEADILKKRIEALKIKDLAGLDTKIALPTISGFMDRPNWQIPEGGMIWEGMNAFKKPATQQQ